MDRRDLIKSLPALAALPFVKLEYKGKPVDAIEVAKHQYMIFVDARVFSQDHFEGSLGFPGVVGEIYFVTPVHGQTVQDAIVIYKVGEGS